MKGRHQGGRDRVKIPEAMTHQLRRGGVSGKERGKGASGRSARPVNFAGFRDAKGGHSGIAVPSSQAYHNSEQMFSLMHHYNRKRILLSTTVPPVPRGPGFVHVRKDHTGL